MNILKLTVLASSAAALLCAAPVTSVCAQDHGNWTLRERESWLHDRIEKSRDDGSLDHVEYDRIRHALDDIRHDEDRMRDHHDGQLTDNETTELETRLDNVAATIHWVHESNFVKPW
jgi:hypothetical protein